MKKLLVFCLLCFSACSPRMSVEYHRKYAYLPTIRTLNRSPQKQFTGSDPYYLVILVDAKHLDYSTPENYFETLHYGLVKRQDPNIGHVWIVLKGEEGYFFEGGHTGEYGRIAPRYFDHIADLAANHSTPDPVSYLYTTLPDGQIEEGSGGHRPTFAAAFPLTQDGFLKVKKIVTEDYDFSSWGLLGPNCIQFARSCLAAIGIEISCDETVPVPKTITIRDEKIQLWENPSFSCIIVQTPELLEKRLIELVQNGHALAAARWYTYKGR